MNIPRLFLVMGASFALIAGGTWMFFVRQDSSLPQAPLPPVQRYEPPAPAPAPAPVPSTSTSTVVSPAFPEALRLDVPFLSQAPKKNWAMPYQEACEEASVLMVQAYFSGKQKSFSPEEGDEAIIKIVDWSAKQYGPELVDMTAQEVATMVEGYMPELEASVKPLRSAEDIKRELVKGFPVILPADGKTLANPHFRSGGPRYHMLVIKGYLADGRWITNDPGTQFGENFLYSAENLLESAHDWNGGDVPNGDSVIVVLSKKSST